MDKVLYITMITGTAANLKNSINIAENSSNK
jgi:hypothetical protein